jgi:hypothetical protein
MVERENKMDLMWRLGVEDQDALGGLRLCFCEGWAG